VRHKPVTLIDGRELAEMFREHGYDVQIDFGEADSESQ
jgi:hypothetical protein